MDINNWNAKYNFLTAGIGRNVGKGGMKAPNTDSASAKSAAGVVVIVIGVVVVVVVDLLGG